MAWGAEGYPRSIEVARSMVASSVPVRCYYRSDNQRYPKRPEAREVPSRSHHNKAQSTAAP